MTAILYAMRTLLNNEFKTPVACACGQVHGRFTTFPEAHRVWLLWSWLKSGSEPVIIYMNTASSVELIASGEVRLQSITTSINHTCAPLLSCWTQRNASFMSSKETDMHVIWDSFTKHTVKYCLFLIYAWSQSMMDGIMKLSWSCRSQSSKHLRMHMFNRLAGANFIIPRVCKSVSVSRFSTIFDFFLLY